MLSGAPPRDAAKEDGDQKCPSLVCRFTGRWPPIASGAALRLFRQGRDSDLGRVPGQQVHVIVLVVELPRLRAEVAAYLPHRVLARPGHARIEGTGPVTKTRWAWSAGTRCRPGRSSPVIVVGRWHAVVLCE
jgi:hypothetical protein